MKLAISVLLVVNKILCFIVKLKRISDKAYYTRLYNIPTGFISGVNVDIYGEGKLTVGIDTYIGNGSTIQLAASNEVSIGSNVAISHNVRMYTSTRNASYVVDGSGPECISSDIYIGDNVWIGANVFIGPGVKIASNVVIGANSVVSKSIFSSGVYGGAPLRRLK